ncbi:HPr kinase [Fictibacillus macauensis ZFHKF-1]|uniref:HPr kinase n=1 Tax=Fictibacillus macauensis ZFHKF-1 TaxID=1196324 RepID=I8J428_9BACL|nr:hypothetical protein [Fictibacillus macauensis]EIT86521.1 HPr kinase [Fictibacillus macauensis ZFHKF-1]
MTKSYYAFGLTIESDLELQELQKLSDATEVDVNVTFTDLQSAWDKIEGQPGKFAVKGQTVMFNVPDTAIFRIEKGERIEISPVQQYMEDKMRLYVLGTCMGVILMQRQTLSLHGSAIAIDGKAYVFVGHSGAGKSTLASAFISKGYPLLSDDIVPITMYHGQVPYVLPSYPQQKLWKESLTQLGMEASYDPLFERENKFAVPLGHAFYNEPLPLGGIIELFQMDDEGVVMEDVSKLEKLQMIYRHTFRQSLLGKMDLIQWHLSTATALTHNLDCYRIYRTKGRFTAYEMVSVLVETLVKKEEVTL